MVISLFMLIPSNTIELFSIKGQDSLQEKKMQGMMNLSGQKMDQNYLMSQ